MILRYVRKHENEFLKQIAMGIIIMLCAGNAYARSEFYENGEFWKTLNNIPDKEIAKFTKTTFIKGIYDVIAFAGDKEIKQLFYHDADNFLIILTDGLDQFYSDYLNINIPVVEALSIISFELRGANQ